MSQLSDQVGRVVGGRYRLIAPLGAGSSAQVFLADDVTLQRKVAVKMLQPALATDQHFLERFRAEAQTVASVNHPNVVVVHDSGVDDIPYLVTEYLAGGSLRGMLAAGHRLTPSQALVVGLEACRGLAHAHGRGLVHRDLKPANLCFGDDGRLRIADFGLARALAESGTTDHGGNHLVGTMRYAAPEQARGERTGPKADVYALGLVLIEAVTGRVPFAGGDPLAALQARTHGDLEVPDALGPLRPAIERAGRLDPDERADAEELGIALLAASERLTAPAALPLVGALVEAAGTDESADERTQIAPAPTADVDDPATGRRGRKARKARKAAEAETVALADPDEPAARTRRRRWPVVLAVLLAVAITAGGLFLAQELRTPTAEVPELAGRQIDDAELIAAQNDWIVDPKKTRRDGTEPGEIVSTTPPPGDRLAEGGTLVVLVSEGNTLTDRPAELVGRPLEEVVLELEGVGLRHEVAEEVHHEEVPAGHVIGTVGDVEASLPKGSVVPLSVSLGPAPRTVPELPDGAGFEVAREALAGVQLEASRADVFSETVPKGQVVALDPAPGATLARGETVTVQVSKGPDLVAVPDLRGMTLDEAEAALQAADLVLGQDCCASRGRVVGSDPGAGTQVRRGTSVNIFLARG
ncbi:MAG TPA: PASTA domain-containing protein [Acidimicrobiales bacterium]|nr:PASTA domain-containing protein [Acidimicrobiales bacterium]